MASLTFHRLPGALATLAAVDFAAARKFDMAVDVRESVRLVTFGAPRVGNYAFATRARDIVPSTFRVVTEGDIITTMPKHHLGSLRWCCLLPLFYWCLFPPRWCCPCIQRRGRYKHFGVECLIDCYGLGDLLLNLPPSEKLLMSPIIPIKAAIGGFVWPHSLVVYGQSLNASIDWTSNIRVEESPANNP